jgi:hypothetical protein
MTREKDASDIWRIGWSGDEPSAATLYGEADLKRIAETLENARGRPLDQYDRSAVFRSILFEASVVLFETTAAHGRPKSKDVKQRLRKVGKAVNDLRKAVSGLDDMSLHFLIRELLGTSLPTNLRNPMAMEIDYLRDDGIKKLREELAGVLHVGTAVEDALKARLGKIKRGPNPDWALYRFIRCVSMDYSHWTSVNRDDLAVPYDAYNERYNGDFFDFVEACIKPLDPIQDRSNQALGELIRRAIGRRN